MNSYSEYLKFDKKTVNINDYIIVSNDIYLITNISNNKYTLINLNNNKIITKRYPFKYIKIDGNNPIILRNEYISLKK